MGQLWEVIHSQRDLNLPAHKVPPRLTARSMLRRRAGLTTPQTGLHWLLVACAGVISPCCALGVWRAARGAENLQPRVLWLDCKAPWPPQLPSPTLCCPPPASSATGGLPVRREGHTGVRRQPAADGRGGAAQVMVATIRCKELAGVQLEGLRQDQATVALLQAASVSQLPGFTQTATMLADSCMEGALPSLPLAYHRAQGKAAACCSGRPA